MGEFDEARKKIKHGEYLTTTDFFVNSLKDAPATQQLHENEYLIQKAAERKRMADEEKKRSGR